MIDSPIAVFSDVRSNLEAFDAVFADMKSCGLESFVCLGDIVGSGASPAECLENIRALDCAVVQGEQDFAVNHEDDASTLPAGFLPSLEFSRAKLSSEQKVYLSNLPLTFTRGRSEFVHASLEDPGSWGHILSSDDACAHFEVQKLPLCFCGHTREPAVWHPSRRGMLSYPTTGLVRLPEGGKTLINVGSVGQPGDGNPLACYVIFDPAANTIEFRRVTYDIAKAAQKIAEAHLPASFAERLARGR